MIRTEWKDGFTPKMLETWGNWKQATYDVKRRKWKPGTSACPVPAAGNNRAGPVFVDPNGWLVFKECRKKMLPTPSSPPARTLFGDYGDLNEKHGGLSRYLSEFQEKCADQYEGHFVSAEVREDSWLKRNHYPATAATAPGRAGVLGWPGGDAYSWKYQVLPDCEAFNEKINNSGGKFDMKAYHDFIKTHKGQTFEEAIRAYEDKAATEIRGGLRDGPNAQALMILRNWGSHGFQHPGAARA